MGAILPSKKSKVNVVVKSNNHLRNLDVKITDFKVMSREEVEKNRPKDLRYVVGH